MKVSVHVTCWTNEINLLLAFQEHYFSPSRAFYQSSTSSLFLPKSEAGATKNYNIARNQITCIVKQGGGFPDTPASHQQRSWKLKGEGGLQHHALQSCWAEENRELSSLASLTPAVFLLKMFSAPTGVAGWEVLSVGNTSVRNSAGSLVSSLIPSTHKGSLLLQEQKA